eukprot:UN02117
MVDAKLAEDVKIVDAATDKPGPPRKKLAANRLVVDDVSEVVAQDGDHSCILLSNEKMEGKNESKFIPKSI